MKSIWLATVFSVLAAGAALADPCKAVPDHGPAPGHLQSGARFSGPVPYIVDGDGFCVAVGSSPKDWVEVRLGDFYAPELQTPEGKAAKQTLERIVRGKTVSCVAGRQSYDRVVAHCTIGSASIGDLMRRAGVGEGGNGR